MSVPDAPSSGETAPAPPILASRAIDHMRAACWGIGEVAGESGDSQLPPLPVEYLQTSEDITYVLELTRQAQSHGRYTLAEKALNGMEEALSAATRSTESDAAPDERPNALADGCFREHVALELGLARARLNVHRRRWWDGLEVLLVCLRRCAARPQGDDLRVWAEVHDLMADVGAAADAASHPSAPAKDAWGPSAT